jgi:hypothetical protein
MTDKIITHIDDALLRIIEQYKCSESMKAIVKALTEQVQIIEDESFGLFSRLDLANATGVLLDQYGTIIGLDRNGLDDDTYRLFLFAKIGQNTSNGEPERVIDNYKLLSGSSTVHLQEYFPAGLGLSGDGDFNSASLLDVYEVIQSIVAAGVRIDSITSFDSDCYFVFDGDLNGEGFSDVSQVDGGCLAELLSVSKDFAFFGGGQSSGGFGDLNDSIIGGTLISA